MISQYPIPSIKKYFADDKNKDERKNEVSVKLEEDPIFVENAGLVICANFLPILFNGFKLIEEDQFVDQESQFRAIHLTQYLATGEEKAPEFDLTLNKLLCGFPVLEPLERQIELKQEERDEAINLLEYLIKHWSILGNTSPAALRNTFLQRRGKLTFETSQSSWLLQVEKQGYDICVEKLPWTISVIKLPWMPERIQVDWV